MVALSSLARIFGEGSKIHSPHALFLFLFFKAGISSHTPIPLFKQGSVHSSSASWDDCGKVFPDELHVSLFSSVIGSNTLPGQHCQPNHAGTRIYARLGVTCHLHFRQNDWGLLCATAAAHGGTDTEYESAQKVKPWRRKFAYCSCQDSNLQLFNESGTLSTSYPS